MRRRKSDEEATSNEVLEPVTKGDWVVLIESPQELLDSFRGINYNWEPAMNCILGQTMKVLDVREDGTIIGLQKSDPLSHSQIWYYSRRIAKRVIKDLHTILRGGVDVLAFLSLACAAPAFRASLETRHWFSTFLSVHISFSVCSPVEVPGSRSWEEAKRRCLKVRERLPQSVASGPFSMYVRLQMKEIPMKRASINRALCRVMPMVRWEDIRSMKLVCQSNIESVDKALYKDVLSLSGPETSLLLTERHLFRSLRKLTFSLTQFLGLSRALGEELRMPEVECVKVFCMDAGFCDEEFKALYSAFPGLRRLHLVTLPAGLLPLCGPGIQAPIDLRMTLTEESLPMDRHANFFVASHLFSLPFSWETDFFRNVTRLQISELNEELRGLSLEKFMDSLKGLPHLRRLGTVSSKAAVLFEIAREESKLEELVLVAEFEGVKEFFHSFVPLEREKRRGRLRRLAVHVVCSDGAARVKLDVENAICAGWYNIVANLMSPDAWVCFSTGTKALQETAIGQLPWYRPQYFCLDTVSYGERSLPCSTPLERQLPYYGNDGREQPSGTLVCGTMRRSAQEASDPGWLPSESSVQSLSSPGGSLSCPTSPPLSRTGNSSSRSLNRQSSFKRKSGRGASDDMYPPQQWMRMHLADSVEALIAAAEAQRAIFSGL